MRPSCQTLERMRKFTQAIHGGAVQARSVVGAASARSELAVLQHRFASEHPDFAWRHPEFTARSVGGSPVSHVHPGAEVAVRLRQQHNAPVSLGESSACQRTVAVNRPKNHPVAAAMNHAPNHLVRVAPCISGFSACIGANRKAVVLSSFHQRSNPSVEGTRSGLRPPRAPHLKR